MDTSSYTLHCKPEQRKVSTTSRCSYRESLLELQRSYWRALLLEYDYNISAIARTVSIYRTHLHRRLKKLGVRYPIRRHCGNWGNLSH